MVSAALHQIASAARHATAPASLGQVCRNPRTGWAASSAACEAESTGARSPSDSPHCTVQAYKLQRLTAPCSGSPSPVAAEQQVGRRKASQLPHEAVFVQYVREDIGKNDYPAGQHRGGNHCAADIYIRCLPFCAGGAVALIRKLRHPGRLSSHKGAHTTSEKAGRLHAGTAVAQIADVNQPSRHADGG